jgi:hypothetical protein
VPKQKITAAEKQKEIEALAANPKEQASQIQKLSAQLAPASPSRGGLELTKVTARVVNNELLPKKRFSVQTVEVFALSCGRCCQ